MLGGALGALLRYGVGLACANVRVLTLPVGTLVVNVAGCFILGLLTALAEQHAVQHRALMLMLSVGFCGAFTTFSTFSAETVKAAEGGHFSAALLYVAASITIGFAMFCGGKELARMF